MIHKPKRHARRPRVSDETKLFALIIAAMLGVGYMTLRVSASITGDTPGELLYVALHTSDISTAEEIAEVQEDYENQKICASPATTRQSRRG